VDVSVTKPLRGAEEHFVQLASMNADLRHVVAGVGASWFSPNDLAEAVGVNQLASAYPGGIEGRQQAERGELARRVRQQVDSDAEFREFARLVEDLDIDADFVKGQRGGQAADSGPDDDDSHVRLRAIAHKTTTYQ